VNKLLQPTNATDSDSPSISGAKPELGEESIKKTKAIVWVFLLQVFSVIPVAIFLLTWFARYSYWLELLCNFQVLIFISMLPFPALFFAVRRKKWAAFLTLFLLLSGWSAFSVFVPSRQKLADGDNSLKILSFNVYHQNDEFEKFIELAERVDPDIVVLLEFSPKWKKHVDQIREKYPFVLLKPRLAGSGVAIYSRLPLKDVYVYRPNRKLPGFRVVRCRMVLGNRNINLFAVHMLSPRSQRNLEIRNRQLIELAEIVNDYEGEKIVVGDFNATTWSPFLQDFVSATKLRDSRQGYGLQPTWPANSWWLRIPIDHAFVSGGISVMDRAVLAGDGSDHLPIFIEIANAADK
jgi:endonuclease/exonuclease/phosphatase (EEP) superfamily protein YafD